MVQRPPARVLRGIPSSRAYWELRADQMMNRIFDPEPTIDVDGRQGHGDGNRPGGAPTGEGSLKPDPAERPQAGTQSNRQTLVLFSALGGVCMVSAASTLLYLNHWNQAQESLRQERNLLLVERLRELGPANPAPNPPPHANQLQGGQGSQIATLPDPPLPPPPPEEAWIQELRSPATHSCPSGSAPAGSRQPPPGQCFPSAVVASSSPPSSACGQPGAFSAVGGRGGRPWPGRCGHLPGGKQLHQRECG